MHPEETVLESEHDFGYDYSYNYDYGLPDVAIHRTATNAVQTLASQSNRVATYNRDSANRIEALATFAGSRFVFLRNVANAVQPLTQSVERAPQTFNRTPVNAVQAVHSVATRTVPNWAIDGRQIRHEPGITLTPETLTLPFIVESDTIDHWRSYESAGDVHISVSFGGAFDAIGRGSATTVTIDPPDADAPPFDSFTGYIDDFDETQLGPGLYRVELEIQRSTNRDNAFDAIDQTDDEWTFETTRGAIALASAHVGPTTRSGSASGGETTLILDLTDMQAAMVADVFGFPDAVTHREVPDGQDFVEDTNGQHTFRLSTPTDAQTRGGDYAVLDWELTELGSGKRRWLVELDIALIEWLENGYGVGYGLTYGI